MGSSRCSLKRSLLLSAVLAASLLAEGGFAQNTSDDDNNTTNQNGAQTTPTTPSGRSSPTTSARTSDSTSQSRSSSSSSSLTLPNLGGSTSSTTTPAPTVTQPRLTLPTLSKTANTAIPDYPAPTVPPTNNAPFMNRSTLPDGTVFIAVGAILGVFGLAILAWRGIVVCLLHRSVERANLEQHRQNDKAATFPPPPAPFYKFLDRDSSPSIPGGPATRKSHRGPTPSATPSQTNLFFSPTAQGSSSAAGVASQGNRDSRFLPPGFYASSAAATGAPGHGHGNSISMSNLRPASRGGHVSAPGSSPPDSPDMGPRMVGGSRNFSSSSVNLNRPPSGRAPSAFLDDLLDDQPGQFPPGGGGHRYSQSPSPPGRGRY